MHHPCKTTFRIPFFSTTTWAHFYVYVAISFLYISFPIAYFQYVSRWSSLLNLNKKQCIAPIVMREIWYGIWEIWGEIYEMMRWCSNSWFLVYRLRKNNDMSMLAISLISCNCLLCVIIQGVSIREDPLSTLLDL